MRILRLLLGWKLWRSSDPLTYDGFQRQRKREAKREARYERQQLDYGGDRFRMKMDDTHAAWENRTPYWPVTVAILVILVVIAVAVR